MSHQSINFCVARQTQAGGNGIVYHQLTRSIGLNTIHDLPRPEVNSSSLATFKEIILHTASFPHLFQ